MCQKPQLEARGDPMDIDILRGPTEFNGETACGMRDVIAPGGEIDFNQIRNANGVMIAWKY